MQKVFDWNLVYNPQKTSGRKNTTCPICSDTRKNKKDKCLYINYNDGVAKCFNCEALTFRDDENNQKETRAHFELPSQDWKNYTTLSDKMVKWLEEERKIPQFVAIELGWTEEKHYQPKRQKEINNLVFNYFEGGTLVNKKYRSALKDFTQSAGTKSIFYNINSVIGQDEVYIVEGEFDVAALRSVGIKNAISVPNGANDNDDYWKNSETYLKDIKRFVIAVDNDEKGNILKERIAQRLGRYRCDFIEWEGKDANDDLKSGVLERTVLQRKKFPVSGTFKVSDLYDGIINLYDNGLPETIFPKSKYFGNLKNVFTTMRGHLVVGTGIPSHGKSNFVDWYVLNIIKDYDFKCSWFSPEHSPMELYQTNIIEKVIGRNFWKDKNGHSRVTKNDIEKYKEWAEERIYLTDAVNNEFPTWDWLFEKFKEQMYSFGIDIFVIDAFNKVLLPKGDKLSEISKVLTKLTHFAQSNNVIIFLVAHPTKMTKKEDGTYSIPSLYDVSGSADFRNMTHDGFTIYRYFENEVTGQDDEVEFINMKTKFSFQGKMTESVKFRYCDVNGRFYTGEKEPFESLIEIEKQELPTPTLLDAFDSDDNDDEVPF